MGWPSLLVFVRHAESEGNIRTPEERVNYEVAAHAYALTDRGQAQAGITGAYLQEKYGEFDVYYSSYYKRAKETLKIMYWDAHHYEDARLAEAQRGIWHTMPSALIAEHYPKEIERKKREGLYHYRPLGGENWADIELRIHSFLGTLNRDCSDQKVLVVAHGHWLILFQRLVEHFSIEEAERRYTTNSEAFENASVTVYKGETVNGKSRLALEQKNFVPWRSELGIVAHE
jgi:broad specificity phosphatase PhoE